MSSRPLAGCLRASGSGIVLLSAAFAGEQVAAAWFGVAPHSIQAYLGWLGLYAGVGALLGALAGARVPSESVDPWIAGAWLAWSTSGRLVGPLGGVAGIAGAVGLGLGSGFALRALPDPSRRGAATGLVFTVAFILWGHLEVWASPLDTDALAGSAVAGVVGLGLTAALLASRARSSTLTGGLGALVVALSLRGLTGPADVPLPAPGARSPDGRPDLILVVVDAWRADHLHNDRPDVHGGSSPVAPEIAALTPRGRQWSHAVTPGPWTLPAFGSLLTGLLPSQHGAGAHDGLRNRRAGLRADVPTLAERLRDAGYLTAGIVSNPWLDPAYGLDRGFLHWDARLGAAHRVNLLQPLDAWNIDLLASRYYRPAARMVAEAERWWSRASGRPRALLLHLMDPHGPWQPPRGPRVPPVGSAAWSHLAYAEEVRRISRHLGPWLERRIAEGGLVILTADHGEALEAKGEPAPDHRHGAELSEAVLRVPLIVWGPGVQPGIDPTPVSLVHVPTTVLRVAGLPELPGAEDVDLRAPLPRPPVVRAESPLFGPWRAWVRSGEWTLRHDGRWGQITESGEIEVPAERVPKDVRQRLQAHLPQPGAAAPPTDAPPGDRRALEALGYVE